MYLLWAEPANPVTGDNPLVEKSDTSITGYHAHVYYEENSKDRAENLRTAIENKFTVTMGRRHDKPVGPHPRWMYQVAFGTEIFAEFIPWLALNRDNLVVLVHPLTGDDVADHRDFAMWLGEKLDLNLDVLK
ncbi:MAG TPA: 4,5-dioxygenase [Sneathiellales bacterium]|nr:4,5-dioxygenase [Sneathiellales bacterium]